MTLQGFVNINKDKGMTSNDVVVKVRGILRSAIGERSKVGHLGTLDPLATGVLPISVGRATRLFDIMQLKCKTYIAEFCFGATTDTLDSQGRITKTCNLDISEEQIRAVLPKFLGQIEQIPPQYSAKSVGGRRAYDIAREQGYVELAPKTVTVYSIELLDSPDRDNNRYNFRIVCGSGTYIRSLARDIASELGTVGYMTALNRTASGVFQIENAITLEEFAKAPLEHILDIGYGLKDFDSFELPKSCADKVLNGVKLRFDNLPDSPFVVTMDGKPIAIGENSLGALRLKVRL